MRRRRIASRIASATSGGCSGPASTDAAPPRRGGRGEGKDAPGPICDRNWNLNRTPCRGSCGDRASAALSALLLLSSVIAATARTAAPLSSVFARRRTQRLGDEMQTRQQSQRQQQALLPTSAPTDRVCACTPTLYRFQIGLNGVCPPPSLAGGVSPLSGVDDYDCQTKVLNSSNNSSVTDLRPVNITSYAVYELNQELEIIRQISRGGLSLEDGDAFEYESITGIETGPLPVGLLPAGMQMDLEGMNADGNMLQSTWIVTFSRRCDVLPFRPGDSISWIAFVSSR